MTAVTKTPTSRPTSRLDASRSRNVFILPPAWRPMASLSTFMPKRNRPSPPAKEKTAKMSILSPASVSGGYHGNTNSFSSPFYYILFFSRGQVFFYCAAPMSNFCAEAGNMDIIAFLFRIQGAENRFRPSPFFGEGRNWRQRDSFSRRHESFFRPPEQVPTLKKLSLRTVPGGTALRPTPYYLSPNLRNSS